jgi:hypothetical protein
MGRNAELLLKNQTLNITVLRTALSDYLGKGGFYVFYIVSVPLWFSIKMRIFSSLPVSALI